MLVQLLAVLAVLVAGIVSAAVVDDDGDDVLETVTAAQASVAAQKTFRSTFALEVDGGGLSITSSGELFVDTVKRAQSGHIRVPVLGSVELREADDVLYVRVPPGRSATQGKSWVSVPADSSGTVGSQDPQEFLKVLSGARDVRELGQEDVNGTSTTHYSLTIDPETLAKVAAANPSASSLPPGVLDQLKDVKTDLWVDDDNLPRRLRVAAKVQSVTVHTAFEYHDFGKPVDVAAPAADDVLQLTNPQQLAQLLRSGG